MPVDPVTGGSSHLYSFWMCIPGAMTDHVFVRYNGRYYDGSYDHTGGASHATINEKADAGISDYYYDGMYFFDGVRFDDRTATLPPERIWYGPDGWTAYPHLLRVPNDPAQNEMEEP